MTFYYVYLAIAAVRYGKKAWKVVHLHSFIFGTPALLNVSLAGLLLLSMVLNLNFKPSLNPAEGQTFFFTIPEFIALNVSAPLSWPPAFREALGNSTWLTFSTYPYYKVRGPRPRTRTVAASRRVTPRHAASRRVTPRHAPSRRVTPRHAPSCPCCRASRLRRRPTQWIR